MTKETGFLDGQPIHQQRPLDRTTRPIENLAQVAGIVGHAQLTHAHAQIGLQEGPSLFVDHQAGTLFQHPTPVTKVLRRQLDQRLQGPHALCLHALPFAHGCHLAVHAAPSRRRASVA